MLIWARNQLCKWICPCHPINEQSSQSSDEFEQSAEEIKVFGKFKPPKNYNRKANTKTVNCLFTGELSNGDQGIINLLTVLANTSELFINRRHGMNTFFATVNGGIISAIVWLISRSFTPHYFDWTALRFSSLPIAALCIIGAIICNKWLQLLKAYWVVSKSKVELTRALESKLGVQVFSTQYNLVSCNEYEGLTLVEARNPQHLMLSYIIILVIAIGSQFLIHDAPTTKLAPRISGAEITPAGDILKFEIFLR